MHIAGFVISESSSGAVILKGGIPLVQRGLTYLSVRSIHLVG